MCPVVCLQINGLILNGAEGSKQNGPTQPKPKIHHKTTSNNLNDQQPPMSTHHPHINA
jgi:hypothetical protein